VRRDPVDAAIFSALRDHLLSADALAEAKKHVEAVLAAAARIRSRISGSLEPAAETSVC